MLIYILLINLLCYLKYVAEAVPKEGEGEGVEGIFT
jgi:hypothetical protein